MYCSNCGAACREGDRFCPKCGARIHSDGLEGAAPLLKRALLFLEDGEWGKADDYCEQVLDREPENAQAYVIKLMIRAQVKSEEALAAARESYADWSSYQNAIRYSDEELRRKLEGYLQCTEEALRLAAEEANRREEERKRQEEEQKRCALYWDACRYDRNNPTIYELTEAIKRFEQIPNYQDAAERAKTCKQKLEELKKEKAHQQLEQQQQEERQQRKRKLYIAVFAAVVLVLMVVLFNVMSASHTKRASEIALRLENTRFVGTHDEFGSYVANGSWGLYESRVQKETTFHFQDSKTVVVDTVIRYDNYPFITKNGEIQWDQVTSEKETYYGWRVDVSLFGRVTVTINGVKYRIDVNAQNDPLSITDDGKSFKRRLG